jgi:murein DD-endopeptidase MepM/ murein hydrolase activator NlpD
MRRLLLLGSCLFHFYLHAQPVINPDGGGGFEFAPKDEITDAQRQQIVQMLQANKLQLQKAGQWAAPVQQVTAFSWPIKQKTGVYDNGFYGISNYIDQNTSFPNLVQDYNCGTRSYDLSSGYNHRGTDIFTWPFGWYKMDYNLVEIIAAAPGTIIGKYDGQFDKNCAMCSGNNCNWNAVYVRHADGSVAWYGHMKSGSLSSKAIGQTVSTGEYLGVVGSSGSSTGPHLHFEVWESESYSKLVDPWAGPCNALNGNTSWWASQQPYYNSTLNAIITHFAAPVLSQCPANEKVNEGKSYGAGQTIYLGSYYRDQQNGQTVTHTVRRPDNSVYQTWNQTFNTYYNSSWWYYSRVLPSPASPGIWTYEVTYNGQTFATKFAQGMMLPYTFNGAGNISDPANWQDGQLPPNPVPSGVELIINPGGGGECIINQVLTLLPGAKLTVSPGSKMRLQQNLQVL